MLLVKLVEPQVDRVEAVGGAPETEIVMGDQAEMEAMAVLVQLNRAAAHRISL
jgi:hypothetical protein